MTALITFLVVTASVWSALWLIGKVDRATTPPIPPESSHAVRNFLRLLASRGGEMMDGDPDLARWREEVALAAKAGYIATGSGWGVSIVLLPAGEAAL